MNRLQGHSLLQLECTPEIEASAECNEKASILPEVTQQERQPPIFQSPLLESSAGLFNTRLTTADI